MGKMRPKTFGFIQALSHFSTQKKTPRLIVHRYISQSYFSQIFDYNNYHFHFILCQTPNISNVSDHANVCIISNMSIETIFRFINLCEL